MAKVGPQDDRSGNGHKAVLRVSSRRQASSFSVNAAHSRRRSSCRWSGFAVCAAVAIVSSSREHLRTAATETSEASLARVSRTGLGTRRHHREAAVGGGEGPFHSAGGINGTSGDDGLLTDEEFARVAAKRLRRRARAMRANTTGMAWSIRSEKCFGVAGETLLVGVPSLLMLLAGVWLGCGAPRTVRAATWFSMGFVLTCMWASHPVTAPAGFEALAPSTDLGQAQEFLLKTTVAAVLIGCSFAVSSANARFLLGAIGTIVLSRCCGIIVLCSRILCLAMSGADSQVVDAIILIGVGLLGAALAWNFEKTSVAVFSSLAGGFGLTVIIHWFIRWGWLLVRGLDDLVVGGVAGQTTLASFVPHGTVVGHWIRLFALSDATAAEYFPFYILWGSLALLGFATQRFLFPWCWSKEGRPQQSWRAWQPIADTGVVATAAPVFQGASTRPPEVPTKSA